jgi:hypothetical protein
MALLHRASMSPTKPELIAAWLPRQPWAAALPDLAAIGGYRIDDPGGAVGMEGILLRSADGAVVAHVPLTYRSAPLEGAEQHLLGTSEHSVLGTRWVYDGTGDPLFLATLADTIVAGGTGAEEYFETDGQRVPREPKVRVRGSGGEAGEAGEVVVVHVVGEPIDGDAVLTGSWDGGSGVLAVLRSAGSR